MSALDRNEVRRLASSLEMMSSPSDGEKLAAVAAVGRILDKHGMRFRDLAPTPQVETSPEASHWSPDVNQWRPMVRDHEVDLGKRHQGLARILLRTGHSWTAWEKRFLTSMTTAVRLTAEQKAKLTELEGQWRGSYSRVRP